MMPRSLSSEAECAMEQQALEDIVGRIFRLSAVYDDPDTLAETRQQLLRELKPLSDDYRTRNKALKQSRDALKGSTRPLSPILESGMVDFDGWGATTRVTATLDHSQLSTTEDLPRPYSQNIEHHPGTRRDPDEAEADRYK